MARIKNSLSWIGRNILLIIFFPVSLVGLGLLWGQ